MTRYKIIENSFGLYNIVERVTELIVKANYSYIEANKQLSKINKR